MQDRILHERSRLNLNDERDRVGLNEKFHDQFHPLSSHLTRKPDSFILENSLTDIGGPGEKSGKICIYSVFLRIGATQTHDTAKGGATVLPNKGS